MLATCSVPGCTTFTIGQRCVEHDVRDARPFVRGRPYLGAAAPEETLRRAAAGERTVASTSTRA